jgi:predicted lipid-binding transport protein (Tim44 family)
MTQPGQPGLAQSLPRAQSAVPAGASRFGGGLMGGLLRDQDCLAHCWATASSAALGAWPPYSGFLLQIALIGGVIMLALRFFRSRQQPALAGPAAPMARSGVEPVRAGLASGPGLSGVGSSGIGSFGRVSPRDEPVVEADFNAFERALQEIQTAYGQEDLGTLRSLVTPEMASYFAEGLAENARNGVVNRVSEPKLLQGDLAEAWTEADGRSASVAPCASAWKDASVERATAQAQVAGKSQ